MSQNSDAARVLLELGANADAKDAQGRTPLHAAVGAGAADLAAALLRAGARVNAKTRAGSTALHLASAVSIFKVLLCKIQLAF